MNQYFVFVNEADATVDQVIEKTILYQDGSLSGANRIYSYQSAKPSVELAGRLYFKSGVLLEKPERPSSHHTWNIEIEQYEVTADTLNRLRSEKKKSIDQRREVLSDGIIQYGVYFWDADANAIKNINGKLQELYAKDALGLAVDVGVLVWRDGLNNMRTWTTAADYKAWLQGLAIAISDRTTSYYMKAWLKKSEVDMLLTIDAIFAYDVETGW